MAFKIARNSALTLSRRVPGPDRLPLRLYERGRGGVFLMLVAAVWDGVPGAVLATQWNILDDGAYIMPLFPIVGAGLFVAGLPSLRKRRRLLIDRKTASPVSNAACYAASAGMRRSTATGACC